MDQVGDFLTLIAKYSPPPRAEYFNQMAKYVRLKLAKGPDSELSLARYLVARLISPAVEYMDSQYATSKIIPSYIKSLDSAEGELGFSEINKVPHSQLNTEVALRSILAALNILKEFEPDSAVFASLTRTLGQTLADMSDSNMQNLMNELKLADQSLNDIESNPKAAFLVNTIRLSRDWLSR
jgi:hypothetical protein